MTIVNVVITHWHDSARVF